MRFFALAPLVALAIAQAADESSTGLAALTSSIDGELSSLSASASSVASSVSSAPTPEVTPTEEQKCISACPENDITCQAACVGVPAPNEQMINDTDKCARNCVQGNGTAEETEAFSNCVQGCISSSFLARPSTASSSSSGSGSNPTGSRTNSASGGSASATEGADSGAAKLFVSASGLVVLFAAFLVL